MIPSYPIAIESLIKCFEKLPGVGRRSAERFVFFFLKSGKKEVAELSQALGNIMQSIKSCESCWDFSDTSPCRLCADGSRDRSLICVVAEPQDMRAIERTGQFKGLYHILRGTLDSEAEHPTAHLKSAELFKRISQDKIQEILLALNPDLPGETTMMYLEQQIKKSEIPVKLSRLARGLPMGSDLQYADEITLSSALKNRQQS
ncbi:MAG: recombination protein RecR [Candidatus Magasanikbacteria bacterium]|nr:recombination protein RecR [Candidatus Magasanikbacteria bacterium]